MNLRSTLLYLALAVAASPAWAQAPSTTGTVTAFSRETGQLAILPGGSHRPVHFRDMKRARYLYGSGRRASFDHLEEGQVITVEYIRRGDRWYVGHVVLPNPDQRAYPAMPPGGFVSAERRASTGRAANDRDITTQPGTTDPRTNTDITKRPDNR